VTTSLNILGPLDGPLSVLTDQTTSTGPSDLVIEVEQHTLATTDLVALARRLTELGWRIAITGFDGGWTAWNTVDLLPVHHLRPDTDLVDRAVAAGPHPAEHLLALTATAAARGLLVAATVTTPPASSDRSTIERLRDLGITHLERRAS